MKRLTDKEWITTNHFQNLNADEVLRRLWELENEVESGKYLELPCKVGDTVYGISPPLRIEKVKVSKISYEVVTKDRHYSTGYFGISLFTDKEQAEAKLKELKGEKE